MSKSSGRFSKLSVLAPAALSACMDASVLAVPAAGAIVSTVLKELSKAFMLKKWFHGNLSAKEAEQLIMERGKNGSFLVRESQTHPGEYVLSVRVRSRVSHVIIHKQHNKYDIGSGEQFDDLVGLIEHFRLYPMMESSGDVLRLLQPVSGTCVRAKDIDKTVDAMNVTDDSKTSSNNLAVESKCGFDREFQSLKLLEDRHLFTTDEGMKKENLDKNRYANVLPFDQTRVVLRDRLGSDRLGSDYINANYIRCPRLGDSATSFQSSIESLHSVQSLQFKNSSKPTKPLVSKSLSDEALKELRKYMKLDKLNGNILNNKVKDKIYIATQGCLSNTKNDFWRMIWQDDVRVIAMITNEYEKGKKKCERYWPSNLHSKLEFDGLSVRLMNVTYFEEYIYRELEVADERNCTRTVHQYQFTAWPDHGTPRDTVGVLQFIDDINSTLARVSQSQNAPEQNMVCVHCSAGVGRTGTFIVLDMLLDNLKLYGSDSDMEVCGTVRAARAQRSGLVQNHAQYRFIYLALQQYLHQTQKTRKVYTSDA